MADLGAVGVKGNLTKSNNGLVPPNYFRKIVANQVDYYSGRKSTVEGDPSQPCLQLIGRGMWRFRWVVIAGSRSVSINVKQAINVSPRPSLIVKANPSIGVNADVPETAGSSTGWVTIGPASITPTSNGAVWVELHANYDGPASSFWDNIQVT